jgi:ribosomal protein S18 acetylase RimI-like enzyme
MMTTNETMKEKLFNQVNLITKKEQTELVNFLHEHLDEFGDTKESIDHSIEYAMDTNPAKGGFILQMSENDNIIGAVVINRTGMEGYIPENILVYIAVHKEYRGKGLGKKMMKRAIQISSGDIALHVEPENPAKHLYAKLGFETPYLEMRYYKNDNKQSTEKEPAKTQHAS